MAPLRVLVIFPFLVMFSLQSPLPLSSNAEEEEDGPFLESDIIVGEDSIPAADFRSHVQRNLVAEPRLLWPDRRVYYDFSGSFPEALKGQVVEALEDLMGRSCVKFARRSGQKTYLKLRATGKGCATKVGFQEGARGPLDLHVGGRRCHTRGTIQHEFLHALGFWHEHTRPDRDRFVSVHWHNVRPGKESNFAVRLANETAILGLPYDFASVMHYKPTAFGRKRGEVTLEPKVKIDEAKRVMGQRMGVTRLDVAKLNRLYNCSGDGKEGYYRGDEWEGKGVAIGEVEEPEPRRAREEAKKGGEMREENKSSHIGKITLSKILETTVNEKDVPCSAAGGCVEISSGDVRESDAGCEVVKSKFKRQVVNSKLQMNEKEVPAPNAHHENFAPQKILPELLKGVLDKDSDRPIVIQFAIYQPIVYKTANETEGSKSADSSVTRPSKEQVEENAPSKRTVMAPPEHYDRDSGSDSVHDDIDLRSFAGMDDYHDLRSDKAKENKPPPKYIANRPDPSRDYIRQQLPDINPPRIPFERPGFTSSNDDVGQGEDLRLYKGPTKEFSRSPVPDEHFSSDHAGEFIPVSRSKEVENDHFTYPRKEPIQPSQKNDYQSSEGRVRDIYHELTKSDDFISSPREIPRSEPHEATISKQSQIGESGYSDIPEERRNEPNRKDYPDPHSDRPVDIPTTDDHFGGGYLLRGGHNIPSSEEHISSDHDERHFGYAQDSHPKDHFEEDTVQYPQTYDSHETKNDNRDYLVIGQKANGEVSLKLGKNGPFSQESPYELPSQEEKRDKYTFSSRPVKVKVENVAPDWKGDVAMVEARAPSNHNDFDRESGSHSSDLTSENPKYEEKPAERRTKPRPDLSLEEDFNDKLDQERRKKLLETASEDSQRARAPLPTTNLQKQSDRPRETRVSVVRTTKTTPTRRTAAKNPKRDLQDEMPPDPEETVEDDIYISESKPMVNLYPHQALPLRACVNMEALQAQVKASR